MPFTHKVNDPTALQLKKFRNLILFSICYVALALFELPDLGSTTDLTLIAIFIH